MTASWRRRLWNTEALPRLFVAMCAAAIGSLKQAGHSNRSSWRQARCTYRPGYRVLSAPAHALTERGRHDAPAGSYPARDAACVDRISGAAHKRAEVQARWLKRCVACGPRQGAPDNLLEDADDPNVHGDFGVASTDTADVFFNSRDFQIFKGIRSLLRDEPVIIFDEVHSRVVRLLRAP